MTAIALIASLCVVLFAQQRAVPQLHALLFDLPAGKRAVAVGLAGAYWGVLGLGLLELIVFGATDPELLGWMMSNGVVFLFSASVFVWTAWFAWSIARYVGHSLVTAVNISITAFLLAADYPILKWMQTGHFDLLPEHLLHFVINLLLISTILRIAKATAGFAKIRAPSELSLFGVRWLTPAVVTLIACIVSDVLVLKASWSIMPAYEYTAISLLEPAETLDALMAPSPHWGQMIYVFMATLFAMAGFEYSRRMNTAVEDLYLWSDSESRFPKTVRADMTNTRLIRATLDMTHIGIVFWRAPLHQQGIGSFDLRSGYTYISAGFIHDAGIKAAGLYASLPDFWKASIHPEDHGGFEALQIALRDPQRNHFAHIVRFAAQDGSWLFVKGEALVERDAEGRPMAFYGIHTDISDQIDDNSRLSVSNQRKLFAMRMLGHDMQSNLAILSMSLDVMQRKFAKGDVAAIDAGVARMRQALGAAMNLVSETMSLARSEEGESPVILEDIRASSFIRTLIDEQCERYRTDGSRVELICEPHWIIRRVNAFALSALVSNLVSNAIKYSPDPLTPVRVRVSASMPHGASGDAETVIEVSDEGIGIPVGF